MQPKTEKKSVGSNHSFAALIQKESFNITFELKVCFSKPGMSLCEF